MSTELIFGAGICVGIVLTCVVIFSWVCWTVNQFDEEPTVVNSKK